MSGLSLRIRLKSKVGTKMKFDPYKYEHNTDLVVSKIVFVEYGKQETTIYTDSIGVAIQANGKTEELMIFNSSISNSISNQLIFIGIPDIFKVRAFQL